MTRKEELYQILELIRKYNLPLSPILEFAIKEMINKRIIKPPIKMTYRGGYTLSYYPIHSVYPYKVKDIR